MAADTVARFAATVLDEEGVKANTSVHLFIDSTSLISDVNTAFAAWLAALDGIVGGQIVRADWVIVPALPGGIKSAPVTGSEVSEVATFGFPQAGTTYNFGNTVPAFLETLETTDHKVDLTAAAVDTYVDLIETSPVLGGYYSGPGNNQLGTLAYTFLAERKHRKQKRAVSYERAPAAG